MKIALRTIVLLAAFAATVMGRANTSYYHVWLDTSSLIGNPAAPFALDFQLNDGAGFGDGSTSASVSNFQFGGGSASGSASVFGDVSGDLSSGVMLTDTTPFNEFYQEFNVGAWLSFSVILSTNFILDETPDLFSFAILDGDLLNLETQSFNADAFLEITVDGQSPSFATFGSADGLITTKVPDALNTGIYSAVLLAALVGLKRRRSCVSAA